MIKQSAGSLMSILDKTGRVGWTRIFSRLSSAIRQQRRDDQSSFGRDGKQGRGLQREGADQAVPMDSRLAKVLRTRGCPSPGAAPNKEMSSPGAKSRKPRRGGGPGDPDDHPMTTEAEDKGPMISPRRRNSSRRRD